MNNTNRRKTINSKGEIVAAPYGSSRWASPRTYGCAHTGCTDPASTLKPANAHAPENAPSASGNADAAPTGAHNCCGGH